MERVLDARSRSSSFSYGTRRPTEGFKQENIRVRSVFLFYWWPSDRFKEDQPELSCQSHRQQGTRFGTRAVATKMERIQEIFVKSK